MTIYSEESINRFWTMVAKGDGCWEWNRSCGSHGYGQAYLSKGAPLLAHRVSWMIAFGEIQNGLFVLHKCDNKICVRPDHLFLGTQADNMRDMCNKGRRRIIARPRGDACPSTKVLDADVKKIIQDTVIGTRQHPGNAAELAAKYGVTRHRIYQIAKGSRS